MSERGVLHADAMRSQLAINEGPCCSKSVKSAIVEDLLFPHAVCDFLEEEWLLMLGIMFKPKQE